jgi:hexosaminidase
MRSSGGWLELNEQTRLVVGDGAGDIGDLLRESMGPGTGLPLPISDGPCDGGIVIHINEQFGDLGEEGYLLVITPAGAMLEAPQRAGLLHGMQSLRQLLPPASLRRAQLGHSSWRIPCLEIRDFPRFQWRGLHLDVARHFMPKGLLLELVELLAFHKLNKLHLHLTAIRGGGWKSAVGPNSPGRARGAEAVPSTPKTPPMAGHTAAFTLKKTSVRW